MKHTPQRKSPRPNLEETPTQYRPPMILVCGRSMRHLGERWQVPIQWSTSSLQSLSRATGPTGTLGRLIRAGHITVGAK